MDLLGRLRSRPHIDRDALRNEMTREDPDFARVREVQHDALNALGAKRGADELAVKRRDRFVERSRDSWRSDDAP